MNEIKDIPGFFLEKEVTVSLNDGSEYLGTLLAWGTNGIVTYVEGKGVFVFHPHTSLKELRVKRNKAE